MRSFFTLAFMAFAVDQLTKLQARAVLRTDAMVELVDDKLWAILAFNPHGAMSWGLGLPEASLRLFLIAFSLVMAAIIVRWMRMPEFRTPTARCGLALISGGGLGNLSDRLWDSRGVTDFLTAGRGVPELGIFNFADVWLVAGAVLVLVALTAQRVKLFSRATA